MLFSCLFLSVVYFQKVNMSKPDLFEFGTLVRFKRAFTTDTPIRDNTYICVAIVQGTIAHVVSSRPSNYPQVRVSTVVNVGSDLHVGVSVDVLVPSDLLERVEL